VTSRRTFLTALAAAAVSPGVAARASQQIITGTNTGAAIVRLAVPEFVSRTPESQARTLTALFNQTVWNDLEFSGILELVSRSFYPLGQFGAPQDIVETEWTSEVVDADFLAFGNTEVRGGQFAVEARLWDMQAPVLYRESLGQLYRSSEQTDRSIRLMAHTFADEVIYVLGGGIRGVARTQIAYESRVGGAEKAIFVMDYDGENARQITPPGVLAITPSWSPDGQRIAFTSYERNQAEIAVISPVDRRGFPFRSGAGLSTTTTTPAFSPDGTRIAFASSMNEVRGQQDIELYVADADGQSSRRLTNSPGVDISPSWNPRTGQHIAFVSDRSGTPQVYIVDAEGGNLRRVVDSGGDASAPAWSPDGSMIAFDWQPSRESTKDIYVHQLASGQNFQLTRDARYNENPTWSPDSRHLAFESDRDGTVQIYSMLANGSKVRRLTTQGRNSNPSWSNYMG